jgi:mRNA interferase RelE/StbE
MSYEIIFTDTSRKQFKKLEKNVQERIIKALERIRIRPEVHVKKLVGDPGYRLRVGEYRVILDIYKDKLIILVIKIGHRKGIYKNL